MKNMKKRYFAMGALALGITVLCMANVIVSDHKVIAKSTPDTVEMTMSEADYELEAITGLNSTESGSEAVSRTVTTKMKTTTAVDAVTKISSSNPDDKLPKQIIPEDQTPVAEDQSAAGSSNPTPVITTVVTHEDVPETTTVITTAPEVPQEEVVVTTVSTEMTTTPTTTTTTTTTPTTTTPTTTTRMECQSELTIAQENWEVPEEESASTSSEKKFSLEEVKKLMDHMYSEGYEIPWDSSEDVRNGIVTLGGYPTVVTDSTYDLGDFVETEYGSAMVVDNTANEISIIRADW